MSKEFILEMRNVRKSFSGVHALKGVSFQLERGSIHALIGENGAGKSTLMKTLSGIYTPDEGEIFFEGQQIKRITPAGALEMGIAMIHQELSAVDNLTIAENMFLRREIKHGLFLNERKMNALCVKYLQKLNLDMDPRTKMGDISVSMKQMVEICKALSRDSKIIVMDEPTSAITESEVDLFFERIQEIKKQGISIIYITHKMDEIPRVADWVSVMRDGELICTKRQADYPTEEIIRDMVGRELTGLFPKENVPSNEIIFQAENITRTGVFQNVSFHVKKGEIVGFAGLVGAGRTEVMRCIFGLDTYDGGTMTLDGAPFVPKSTQNVIRSGIAMVPEDRKLTGLVLNNAIRENVTMAFLKNFVQGGFIRRKKEAEVTQKMIDRLRIKTPDMEREAQTLSGGNQQKVVLAKWLVQDAKMIIFDEPTRGIDVGAKSEIHKLMSDLASQGVGVIMISSELPEVLGMSDRIYIMHEGLLKGELSKEDATQEKIMRIAVGG